MSGCRIECPHCGHDRNHTGEASLFEGVVYRRRKCSGCDKRFSTVEMVMPENMRHIYRSSADWIKGEAPAQKAKLYTVLRTLGQDTQKKVTAAKVPRGPKGPTRRDVVYEFVRSRGTCTRAEIDQHFHEISHRTINDSLYALVRLGKISCTRGRHAIYKVTERAASGELDQAWRTAA